MKAILIEAVKNGYLVRPPTYDPTASGLKENVAVYNSITDLQNDLPALLDVGCAESKAISQYLTENQPT